MISWYSVDESKKSVIGGFVPVSFPETFSMLLQLGFRFQNLKRFPGVYSGFSYNLVFFSKVPFFAWGCLKTVSFDFSISLA